MKKYLRVEDLKPEVRSMLIEAGVNLDSHRSKNLQWIPAEDTSENGIYKVNGGKLYIAGLTPEAQVNGKVIFVSTR